MRDAVPDTLTLAQACQIIIDLTRKLSVARRERDDECLRADRATASFDAQGVRLREALHDNYRLRRDRRSRPAA